MSLGALYHLAPDFSGSPAAAAIAEGLLVATANHIRCFDDLVADDQQHVDNSCRSPGPPNGLWKRSIAQLRQVSGRLTVAPDARTSMKPVQLLLVFSSLCACRNTARTSAYPTPREMATSGAPVEKLCSSGSPMTTSSKGSHSVQLQTVDMV